MTAPARVLVTGANGQLGQLVVAQLLSRGVHVIAGVRSAEKGAALAAMGAEVRIADYSRPETLATALAGVDRLVLISGNEVGQRVGQHSAVIEAAKAAGVRLIAYTSILRAATSPLPLAVEHKATEEVLAQSGVPHIVLRNGWYSENYLAGVGPALEHGAVLTCAGDGRFSAAPRAELAEATAVLLAAEDTAAGRIYELAGSTSFSMPEFARHLSALSGKDIACVNLREADYAAALTGAGLPEAFAQMLARTDTLAQDGALEDNGRDLEKIIGRPTSPIEALLKGVVAPPA